MYMHNIYRTTTSHNAQYNTMYNNTTHYDLKLHKLNQNLPDTVSTQIELYLASQR